jgi:uncharacterized protein YdaU (DUF1376 family)
MKVRHVDWYADEWLAGTTALTAEERGVYITICCLIYSRGGPIPDVEADLALQEVGKIISENGHVEVRRCSREIEKALKRSSEASQNAITRWANARKTNDVEDADAVQTRNANHQPTNHQPTNHYARSRARAALNGNGSGDGLLPAEPWQQRLAGFRKNGFWLEAQWGPKPGDDGCQVPAKFLS